MTEVVESAKVDESKASHALIEWTGLGIKHFKADNVGEAFCIPGAVTPVPVELWAAVRDWVKDLIVEDAGDLSKAAKDAGRFIEHHVVIKKGPGGRVSAVLAKDLPDLQDSEARALIAKMFDTELLTAYMDDGRLDGRPALLGAVERQIREIEKNGTKGKK